MRTVGAHAIDGLSRWIAFRALFIAIALVTASCEAIATPSAVHSGLTPAATPVPTVAAGTSSPTNGISSESCGSVVASLGASISNRLRAASYSNGHDVFVYDVGRDNVERFGGIEPAIDGLRPQFRDSQSLSVLRLREPPDDTHTFGQDSIVQLDLETGEAIEIVRLPTTVLGYAWNPAGTLLAYQVHVESGGTLKPVELCLLNVTTESTTRIRSLGVPFLSATGNRDETLVAWSPEADRILSVDTLEQPSLIVSDLDGTDLVPPAEGTFARWLSEDDVLYARPKPGSGELWEWVSVGLRSGSTTQIALPGAAFRPTISTDAAMIAFDDGKSDHPSVFTFDLQSSSINRVSIGQVGPIWLDEGVLAASNAGPCADDDFCVLPWKLVGGTVEIQIPRGTASGPLPGLQSTLAQVVRFGPIDVTN
jgi:hypothetical protein